MKRTVIALLSVALLLSGCKGKSSNTVPATASPAPTATPTATPPITTTVNVVVTFQGTLQPSVLVTESSTYNYATMTPGTTIVSGTTGSNGSVALAIGAPASTYCFSANYTPAGQSSAIKVANCQPTLVGVATVTLGN